MSRKRKVRTIRQVEKHGHDGLMQIAAADVADPFEPTKTVAVIRNVAAPVDNLFSRGRIDNAQFAAAQKFKRLYDLAAIGGARAIDYGREHVDGGRVEQISIKALEAGRERAQLASVVSKRGMLILDLVIGEEMALSRVVRRVVSNINNLQGQGYVVCRLVEALDSLVDHWGLIAIAKEQKRAIRVSSEAVSGPQSEWAVGRFGDLVDIGGKINA